MFNLFLNLLLALNSSASTDLVFQFDKKVKSCPVDANLLAKEFLITEEKGVRVRSGIPSCITNTNLKYIKALRPIDYRSESGTKERPYISVKKDSMKVENIQLLSDETLEYEVKFSALDSKTGKPLKDSFKFMSSSLASGNKRPSFGCAHLSKYPKKVYVSEDCVKN